jgi:hypothetical protein
MLATTTHCTRIYVIYRPCTTSTIIIDSLQNGKDFSLNMFGCFEARLRSLMPNGVNEFRVRRFNVPFGRVNFRSLYHFYDRRQHRKPDTIAPRSIKVSGVYSIRHTSSKHVNSKPHGLQAHKQRATPKPGTPEQAHQQQAHRQ